MWRSETTLDSKYRGISQCRTVIARSIFTQIFTKDTPWLARRGWWWCGEVLVLVGSGGGGGGVWGWWGGEGGGGVWWGWWGVGVVGVGGVGGVGVAVVVVGGGGGGGGGGCVVWGVFCGSSIWLIVCPSVLVTLHFACKILQHWIAL